MWAADLFAGAGGLSTGLGWAGFHVAWAVEMNEDACATYRASHPRAQVECCKLESGEGVPPVELLCGGPPCQSFSQGGHNEGALDDRNGFPVFLDAVARIRPLAVLIENVPGILQPSHVGYFQSVLEQLSALGYWTAHTILQAADFGVPQRRKRVFVVAVRDEAAALRFRWPTPTHSLEALVKAKWPDGVQPHGATPSRIEAAALKRIHAGRVAEHILARLPWVTVRQALGASLGSWEPGATVHSPPVPRAHSVAYELPPDVDRGGYDKETASRAKSLLYETTLPDLPADTVSVSAEEKASEHAQRLMLRVRASRYSPREEDLDWPSSTVAASWDREQPTLVVRNLGAGDGHGAALDEVAPTVPAESGGTVGLAFMDGGSKHQYVDAEGRVHTRPATVIRRLAPEECALLQGFPPDYPWQGSTRSKYRQIGNAVPPPLAWALGASIMAAMRPAS